MGGIKSASVLAAGLCLLGACDSNDSTPDDDGKKPPTLGDSGPAFEKPTWDWGYKAYSTYNADGSHKGKTIYQTDPACANAMNGFSYHCELIDGQLPDDSTTNPTDASGAETGGLDQCREAIVDTPFSYCLQTDPCQAKNKNNGWAPGQSSFDNYAYMLFLALMWPADAQNPGYPDTSKSLKDLVPDEKRRVSTDCRHRLSER